MLSILRAAGSHVRAARSAPLSAIPTTRPPRAAAAAPLMLPCFSVPRAVFARCFAARSKARRGSNSSSSAANTSERKVAGEQASSLLPIAASAPSSGSKLTDDEFYRALAHSKRFDPRKFDSYDEATEKTAAQEILDALRHDQRRKSVVNPQLERYVSRAANERHSSSAAQDDQDDGSDYEEGDEFEEDEEEELGDDDRKAADAMAKEAGGADGADDDDDGRLVRTGLKQPKPLKPLKRKHYYIPLDPSKCPGCGVIVQHTDPDQIGYRPLKGKTSNKKMRLCQRCFCLRHYNRVASPSAEHVLPPIEQGVSIEDVRRYLGEELQLSTRQCVVVLAIDLFDMHKQGFLHGISKLIGPNPLIVVGNKADLLPEDVKLPRVKHWLHMEAKERCDLRELSSKHVHVVSATTGVGMRPLIRVLEEIRRGRDIYVVGAVNAGKTSLINRIARVIGIGGIRFDAKYALTTSSLPGTTIDLVSLPIRSGGKLHDTPGIASEHILHELTPQERAMVIPTKAVRPRSFRIVAGKSIFLGGLARLDYLEGPPLVLNIFAAPGIALHPTSIERADNVYQAHFGEAPFQPPMLEIKRSSEVRHATDTTDDKTNGAGDIAAAQGNVSSDVTLERATPLSRTTDDKHESVEGELERLERLALANKSGAVNKKRKSSANDPKVGVVHSADRMQSRDIELEVDRRLERAFADIVFPGLGWVGLALHSSHTIPDIKPLTPLREQWPQYSHEEYERATTAPGGASTSSVARGDEALVMPLALRAWCYGEYVKPFARKPLMPFSSAVRLIKHGKMPPRAASRERRIGHEEPRDRSHQSDDEHTERE